MSEGADLLAQLRAAGITQASLSRSVDRSPRFLRAIQSGAKPAPAAVVEALRKLTTTGEVTQAPRRQSAGGELAKVRAPRSAGVASVTPTPGANAVTHVKHGGGVLVTLNVGHIGRVEANAAIMAQLQAAAREGRQIKATVTLKDGRVIPLFDKGGISAKAKGRRGSKGHSGGVAAMVGNYYGGDALGWFAGQANAAGYGDDVEVDEGDIDSIDLSTF